MNQNNRISPSWMFNLDHVWLVFWNKNNNKYNNDKKIYFFIFIIRTCTCFSTKHIFIFLSRDSNKTQPEHHVTRKESQTLPHRGWKHVRRLDHECFKRKQIEHKGWSYSFMAELGGKISGQQEKGTKIVGQMGLDHFLFLPVQAVKFPRVKRKSKDKKLGDREENNKRARNENLKNQQGWNWKWKGGVL